jgi:4-hydroxy-2-oxoheptanedioate aldolase
VVEALEGIRDRCREHGVAVGTFVEDIATARRWHASGVSYISYSVDVGIFTEACQGVVEQLRRP